MSSADEQSRRRERAEQVAYWRYQLIRDAADPALSSRARGRLVRSVAATVHQDPFGQQVRVSRQTLNRWIRAWRRGGFTALVPPQRQVTPRTPAEVLDLAAGGHFHSSQIVRSWSLVDTRRHLPGLQIVLEHR